MSQDYRRGKFGMPLPLGSVPAPPTGEAWLHEIKHDGFRVIARKQGDRVSMAGRTTT